MLKYRNVLVGVQFRVGSSGKEEQLAVDCEQAVSSALELAGQQESRITFAHVFDLDHDSRAYVESSAGQEGGFLSAAQRALAGLVARASEFGIEAIWKVLFGRPWQEFVTLAGSEAHDLVVVGAPPRPTGSMVKRLIGMCPSPVWVVRPQLRRQCKSVLIATDMSSVGEEILRHGLSMARRSGGELHIVHAVENWFGEEGRAQRVGESMAAIESAHETKKIKARINLELRLASALDGVSPDQNLRTHVESGEPADVICRTAKIRRVDLVVMGSVGDSRSRTFPIGSTAERLLARLSCSLLAIKPRDFVYPGC